MAKVKARTIARTDDDVRDLILRYFFERNRKASSLRGKHSGAAVSISVLRADLKSMCELTREEVVSNLTYLLRQCLQIA